MFISDEFNHSHVQYVNMWQVYSHICCMLMCGKFNHIVLDIPVVICDEMKYTIMCK